MFSVQLLASKNSEMSCSHLPCSALSQPSIRCTEGFAQRNPASPHPTVFPPFFSISRARSVGASRAAKHPPLRLVPTEVARQRAETVTRTQWEATLMDTRGTTQGSATILFNTFHGSLHPSEMREVPLTLGLVTVCASGLYCRLQLPHLPYRH